MPPMKMPTLVIATIALITTACARSETLVVADTERAIERAYLQGDRAALAAAIKPVDAALAANSSDPALVYERAFGHYAASASLFRAADKAELKSELKAAAAMLATVHGQPWEAAALHGSILGQLIGLEGGMSGMTLGPKSNQLISGALKQSPNSPRALLFHGIGLLNTPPMFGGDAAKGAKLIQRAIDAFAAADEKSAGPHWGSADAWAWLGIAKRGAGDAEGARAAWQKALAIQPNYGWVKFALLPSLDKKNAK
jgi:tetratricopeptide (TPR) repeat protein